MTPEAPHFQNIPGILIVDDVSANLDLLSNMLRRQGYVPRPVLSGMLALSAAKADPPDLVLLDINMPIMNGYEVCECFKADESLKDIPIIFITAYEDTTDKVKAFSMGAVDYVTKPFQIEEVAARVRTHLKIRSLQRQLVNQNENLAGLVEERTLELARAHERVLELGRLKDNLLRMISHEIRTPATGVLGIGNLILDLCPPSEDLALYAELFQNSSLRLEHFLDDATMIVDMENLLLNSGEVVSFLGILDKVRASLPSMHILIPADREAALKSALLKGNQALLTRAMQTMVLLAASFSKDKQILQVTGAVEAGALGVRLDLDALSLSEKAASSFFDIESTARLSSPAEPLGLAPIVAHKIISALGGRMRLLKEDGNRGALDAVMPLAEECLDGAQKSCRPMGQGLPPQWSMTTRSSSSS